PRRWADRLGGGAAVMKDFDERNGSSGPRVETRLVRRMTVGAELDPAGGVHFRVWADRCKTVEGSLRRETGTTFHSLERDSSGHFSGTVPEARAGSRYRYRLDGGEAFPDPASRFQPEGPHGPSEVIDPASFEWTDSGWRGLASLEDQVIYELH